MFRFLLAASVCNLLFYESSSFHPVQPPNRDRILTDFLTLSLEQDSGTPEVLRSNPNL